MPANRVLLGGALFGIACNSYDKFRYGHIVDTFRLINGLSFNLADILIVIGVVGVIIRYRWPRRREQSNIGIPNLYVSNVQAPMTNYTYEITKQYERYENCLFPRSTIFRIFV